MPEWMDKLLNTPLNRTLSQLMRFGSYEVHRSEGKTAQIRVTMTFTEERFRQMGCA